MKKTALCIMALCGVAGVSAGRVSAQNPDRTPVAKAGTQVDSAAVKAVNTPAAADSTAAEVEALRKRVGEIERQNQQLIEALSELKGRLDAMNHPAATASVTPAAAAPAQPAGSAQPAADAPQAPAQAGQSDKNAPVPLFPTVNNDTLQWNAGNVGDRRPQFRAAYEPKVGRGKFSFLGGLGLTGAIDSADLDANGVRDGEESGLPNIQARVGFAHPLGGSDRTASIGVSGFYGFLKTARPVGGRTDFHSQLVNVDFTLPLLAKLAFRGEGWWGRNMSDIRGGAGQGVTSNGLEIRGRGGWAEANIRLSKYLSTNPGFSTDDPVDTDIPLSGRTRNRAFFVANRITPGGNFILGADYLRWKTNFRGLQRGIDNRVNVFLQYNF
ncbi:MAG: hypothetical protein LC776_02140 [Acidobacteria bacterium]|nr:hypothetical protein [Acidobacteriota bacterium]